MFGSMTHWPVAGSKTVAIAVPTKVVLPHAWPPASRTRPSARATCAEQNKSLSLASGLSKGTGVNVLVAGSHTRADSPPWQKDCPPSHIRILPLSSRAMLMATRGQFITADHWPITAGSLGLTTLTVMTRDTVVLPAASRARADRVCEPRETVELSQESV